MPRTKHVEVHVSPILLQPGDSLRLSPRGEAIAIKETALLIWVDQAPGYRFAHPAYTVILGAAEVEVLPGSWWVEVDGRRFPRLGRQVPGLLSPVEFSGIAVHTLPGVITPEDRLMDGREGALAIKRESVVLWVDLHPEAKFAHPTRYVILDARGGRVIEGSWWPTFGGRGRALGAALASPARWDLEVGADEPETGLPHTMVQTVTHADVAPLKVDPKRATLSALGTVPTSGWSEPRLVPHVYVTPPADGIWGFDLVARPPEGIALTVISPVAASAPLDTLNGVAGVRIHATQGALVLRLLERCAAPSPGDPFQVEGARFEADQLVVEVSYSGGCRDHQFHLQWTGALMKSHPPQAELILVHDAQGDPCRAMIREVLRFDLLDLPPATVHLSDGHGWQVTLPYRLG